MQSNHHRGSVSTTCLDLSQRDDDDSSYSPSDHGSDNSSASYDADDDLDFAIDANNITGVAEHDKEDEEPNDNDDGYIEIAGVNNDANNNEHAGMDADEHPLNDNYYPQDFYDEAANDDNAHETKDEVIHLDHPDEDNIPIVEMVEDEEDPCNALEHAMVEQYGIHTGTYNLHP